MKLETIEGCNFRDSQSSVFEYDPEYDSNSPLPENNIPTFTRNVRKIIELISKVEK